MARINERPHACAKGWAMTWTPAQTPEPLIGKGSMSRGASEPLCPPAQTPEQCLSPSAPPVSHLLLLYHLLWLMWGAGETRGGTVSVKAG